MESIGRLPGIFEKLQIEELNEEFELEKVLIGLLIQYILISQKRAVSHAAKPLDFPID